MSQQKSYLPNNLPDYEPNSQINPNSDDYLKKKITELSDKIWNHASQQKHFENDDIYSGNTGIAYMFWYLSQQMFSDQQRQEFLTKAKSLISQSLNAMVENGTENSVSFLSGRPGIYLIASLIFDSCNEEKLRDHHLNLFTKFAPNYIPNDFNNEERDTLFNGRAGFVSASLIANKLFRAHIIPPQTLHNIGISTIKSGKYYSINSNSKLPIIYEYKGQILFNTSHGMSGILLSMLCTPDFLKIHPNFENHIKSCVDYILSQQTSEGSYVKNIEESEKDLIDWCDGSSGVLWLMAKAFKLWPQNSYKDSLIRCGELIWRKGLSCRGPGLCHGIVGNGYAFLLLFRLTSDPKYTHRAKQFAYFMLNEEYMKTCETFDKPYGLYEGLAGTVCYLADVLQPQQSLFPLYIDIFEEENSEICEDIATMSDSIKDFKFETIKEE